MFIRASTQRDKKTKRPYTTYRLVESYRNQDGKARQHTLLNLGSHFSISKVHWKLLADRIEEIRRGQKSLFDIDATLEKEAQRIGKLITQKFSQVTLRAEVNASTEQVSDFQAVDVNSLEYQDVRKVGAEHVCYHAAKQLQLDKILSAAGFNQKQIHVAMGNIIGRLVQPGSELSTHRYLTSHSALDELLGVDFSNLPLKRLYQISDRLLTHKTAIEHALYQREKDLFNLEESVT